MSSFTALPPPDQVLVDGETSYRYVRQESALWSSLHCGRLTTSRLKDALGLRDSTASRIVGGPQYPEPGVMKAYNHLLEPLYVPPPPAPLPPPQVPSSWPAAPAPAQAAAVCSEPTLHQNEAARLAYNGLCCTASASGAQEEGSDSFSAGLGEYWSEADRRRVSELAALSAAAGGGGTRMRLLWGNLQEGAAVATLSLLFPTSQLEEVGLVCMPDPSRWGVDPAELPPLGASPDAFITHHIPIRHSDLEAARQRLLEAAGGSPATVSPEAARAEARSLLRSALSRHSISQPGPDEAPRHVPPVGSSEAGASHYGDRSLPLYDNSNGGALEWVAGQLVGATVFGTGAGTVSGPSSGSDAGSGGTAGDDVAAVVRLREVVEVKNHCPFVYKSQRKARKRGMVLKFVVSDRGPQSSLWPLWVPQLQAHMACSGADSALLLSRSPSKGVRVFRMFRDDSYVTFMLQLVRELQVAHVLRQQPPGGDPWVGRPGYSEFLQQTVAIARGAETVIATATTPHVPGTDPNSFWKLR